MATEADTVIKLELLKDITLDEKVFNVRGPTLVWLPPPYLYFISMFTSLGANPKPFVFRKFDESTTAGAKPDGAPLRLGGNT